MDKVKQLRKERKLTQEELARILGWSRPKVARIENGYTEPSGEDLEALAQAFKCRIKDFFEGGGV